MRKILSLFGLLSFALISCGGGGSKAQNTIQLAVERTYVPYFTELAGAFNAANGTNIQVIEARMFEILDALPHQRGNSADIFMTSHDRIGSMAVQQLIMPITIDISAYTEAAQTSSTFRGQTFMVPMSTDTTLLLFDRNRTQAAPTYLSQLPASDFVAKFTDFYYSAGLVHAFGGYIFNEGNTSEMGLNNAGAVRAGEVAQAFYQSGTNPWTLMRDDTIANDLMLKLLIDGDVKFIINGPWTVHDLMAAGVDVGAVPIPSWDGTLPYRPLASTKGMAINNYSRHKETAVKFLTFIATAEHAKAWHTSTQEVSPHREMIYPADSIAQVVYNASAVGVPIPNVPEMMFVWEPMRVAFMQIASGQNIQAALDAAVADIQHDISRM